MNQILEFFRIYTLETMILMAALLVLLLIINIIILFKTNKMKKNYRKLLNGREEINVEELLIETGRDINKLGKEIGENKELIRGLETSLSFAIQKVGFVRYNAYAEMGSDQSFSLALLDSFKNGFVITSIYGRDHASTYGKPVKNGKSDYPLSVEEIQAIDRAIIGEISEKRI